MKKISAAILAITAVTAISCQREIPDSGTVTGEVEFTVTAGIPGGISTYADPVAAFSHNGGAVNVDHTEYDLRYILEVYTKDQPPVRVYRKTVIVPDNFTTTDVTITARLVAKKYDFVFWADFVEEGSGEDTEGLHYDTDQLTSVSYKEGTALEDLASEAIDAYCHVEEVDLSRGSGPVHKPEHFRHKAAPSLRQDKTSGYRQDLRRSRTERIPGTGQSGLQGRDSTCIVQCPHRSCT